nr:Fanconi anemia core complex-associated protein 20 isoform X2 [Pelodiscus sinensis]|eukprot:XP_025038463.1 Fanconi anemia core complex-associated protein 20 isoform X2 [Pelodiscus sinensis]
MPFQLTGEQLSNVSSIHNHRTLTNRVSWFEQQELSESENMWMLIMKGVSQHLTHTSWKTVPSLPEFLAQLCKGTVLSEENNRRENESQGQHSLAEMHQHNILLGKTSSVSAEIKSPVDIPKMEGLKEKAEDQRAGTVTLDSCPMCLIQFTGTLSQLDIDSHLAKCLSESADDVIW